jgi:hypothetical protein
VKVAVLLEMSPDGPLSWMVAGTLALAKLGIENTKTTASRATRSFTCLKEWRS